MEDRVQRSSFQEALSGPVSTRLVVYGSLAPGESNHHVVSHLGGEWLPCEITGFVDVHRGYRILTWDPDGPVVRALLLVSPALPDAWTDIDAFEGDAYRRVVVPVRIDDRTTKANVYVRNSRTTGEMRS